MKTMRAIEMQGGKVSLKTRKVPKPGAGQVLVKSLACGICGSDLHITRHGNEVFDIYKKLGLLPEETVTEELSIMLGHEFCAEIAEFGPQTQRHLAVGSRVTSVPILLSQGGAGIGVTPGLAGAYSEYFVVDESLLLAVPENVSSLAAAMTEPLAVGLHAVSRSNISDQDVALVAGSGPIGLAVINALKMRGIRHIVASDPQTDKRQAALEFGATLTVDPGSQDEVQLASALCDKGRLVIFECVGIHQLINSFIQRAPDKACLVVTGVHTAETSVNFGFATVKEMDIKFSYYYTAEEFASVLQAIAEEKVNWQRMCTGKVGIDGVVAAFDRLMASNEHIKIVIEPWRNGALELFAGEEA